MYLNAKMKMSVYVQFYIHPESRIQEPAPRNQPVVISIQYELYTALPLAHIPADMRRRYIYRWYRLPLPVLWQSLRSNCVISASLTMQYCVFG
jgi:hypothetical protein